MPQPDSTLDPVVRSSGPGERAPSSAFVFYLPGADSCVEATAFVSGLDGALVIHVDSTALGDERVLRVEVNDGTVYHGSVFSAHPDLGARVAALLAPYLSELWTAWANSGPGGPGIGHRPPGPRRCSPAGFLPRDAVRALAGSLGRAELVGSPAESETGDLHFLRDLAALVRWFDIHSTVQVFAPPRTLRSILAGGYTPEKIEDVLGLISRAAGVRVVCGWDYCDAFGYGGDSEFYLLGAHGLYELAGPLWSWLNDDPATAPVHPGSPAAGSVPRYWTSS